MSAVEAMLYEHSGLVAIMNFLGVRELAERYTSISPLRECCLSIERAA